MSYNSHHNSTERRAKKQCRRRGASSGQKTKRGIEGEDPLAAGIERFFSLKRPPEENNVRASFILVLHSAGISSLAALHQALFNVNTSQCWFKGALQLLMNRYA